MTVVMGALVVSLPATGLIVGLSGPAEKNLDFLGVLDNISVDLVVPSLFEAMELATKYISKLELP